MGDIDDESADVVALIRRMQERVAPTASFPDVQRRGLAAIIQRMQDAALADHIEPATNIDPAFMVTAAQYNAVLARLDAIERDPAAVLDAYVSRATLEQLDALNEALDRVGIRMVERAAELRKKLSVSDGAGTQP